MKTIKLADWCEKTGVKYLTAWRWFNAGEMPVHSYQTESGTILVEDKDSSDEQAISVYLKKMSEINQNNGTVEDFAAWTLSTFSLQLKEPISKELPEIKQEVQIAELPNWQNMVGDNLFAPTLPTTLNSFDYSTLGIGSTLSTLTANTFDANTVCVNSLMPTNNSIYYTGLTLPITEQPVEPVPEKAKRGRPKKEAK
jgi:hypothetical protein